MSKPPIFIGGAGRSGTTLLRVILDSHSNIACGPELKITPAVAQLWQDCVTVFSDTMRAHFLAPEDVGRAFANLLTDLTANYREQQGKKRTAEKSPHNVFIFTHLHRIFPESPLVHVIRDGRDVVASLLRMDWRTPQGEPLDYTRDAGKAARYWVNAVAAGRTFATGSPTAQRRYLEVRYEDLVREPEQTLESLFAFVDEPWEPEVLRFHEKDRDLAAESSADDVSRGIHRSAVGRWRTCLKRDQVDTVREVAGAMLVELGYEESLDWS